jgi:hypothetical protein
VYDAAPAGMSIAFDPSLKSIGARVVGSAAN